MSFEYLEHLPDGKPQSVVIWLHGLGASAEDFYPAVSYLKLDKKHHTAFVFPHAPKRPITINSGMVMRGWYDIKSLVDLSDEDSEGLLTSSKQLISFIGETCERLSVLPQNVILGGFSQGGALSLYTWLQYKLPLKACFLLSCYLPTSASLPAPDALNTPALFIHGKHDPVVPFAAGMKAHQTIKDLNIDAKFKAYPYQHEVSLEAFEAIGEFLSAHLPE